MNAQGDRRSKYLSTAGHLQASIALSGAGSTSEMIALKVDGEWAGAGLDRLRAQDAVG